jgi:hypothetical protein
MATVHTSVESARGCGFRKSGGMYLVSDGIGIDCPLLPIELCVCPVCHSGIKPTRGWTWVEPDPLLPHHYERDAMPAIEANSMHSGCPLNQPGLLGERVGLLWIGEAFYPTPHAWITEGKSMGFSRRIPAAPRDFKVGETWVLVAHRKAIVDLHFQEPLTAGEDGSTQPEPTFTPGIFHIWKPDRLEYVIKGDETEEELDALEARGFYLVEVIRSEQTEIAVLA